MPITIEQFRNLIDDKKTPGALRTIATTSGDTINEHSINHHIFQQGPIIAQDPTKGVDYIPVSPGYWFKWRNTANINMTSEGFKHDFAKFNAKIIKHIINSRKYETATGLDGDPQRPNHYSVKIPFSDADFDALFLHSGSGGRRDPLYDLHGPSSRSLQEICINIDNNLVTSIMPSFSGDPRDRWNEH